MGKVIDHCMDTLQTGEFKTADVLYIETGSVGDTLIIGMLDGTVHVYRVSVAVTFSKKGTILKVG